MASKIKAKIVNDNAVQVTDAETGHFLFEIFHVQFEDTRWRIWEVAVSPNGKYIATAGKDTTARLWDGATGELIRVVTAQSDHGDTSNHEHKGGYIWSVDFSPDSRIFATGGYDGQVLLWETATTKLLVGIEEFGGATQNMPGLVVRFAEDGKSLRASLQGETKVVFHLPEIWWPQL